MNDVDVLEFLTDILEIRRTIRKLFPGLSDKKIDLEIENIALRVMELKERKSCH
jgi:hypothetical protein